MAYDPYLNIIEFVLSYSALLSILSIALTLRHKASGIPDFSITLYVGLGVCVTVSTAAFLNLNLYASPLLAFLVGCIIGATYYGLVMRLMERRGDSAIMRALSTIGVEIFGSGLISIFAYWVYIAYPNFYGGLFHIMNEYDFALWDTQGIYYVVPLVCAVVYLTFFLLFRTTLGLRLVASEENPELAMVQGVDPWQMKLFAWSLSGGIACLAGSLFPPFYHIEPAVASLLLPAILAAGVIGGFESLGLAVAAAFIVGSIEILITFWLMANVGGWTGDYRVLIPIALLYFSMLFMPRGLVAFKKLYGDRVGE